METSYALQLTLINEISMWKNLVKYVKILPIRKDLLRQENKGRFYSTIKKRPSKIKVRIIYPSFDTLEL